MKILTVLICLCVLMGCGEKVEPKQQEEAPSTPKVEANAPVTPKPQPKEELENPQPPKTTPEKLIADPIIEKAVREALSTPISQFTGELTEADLEKVKWLSLERNQLTEVPKGLEKLTQLKELALWHNKLTDVKGLEKLTQLTYLTLQFNQLTSVKGLEKLNKLNILSLAGNQLTDVKGLEKLTQLTHLYLENNPDLTKAQIDELKKALPKCQIESNPKK